MAPVIFALLIGILPALFWLWFWLHEDAAKPEPKALIGLVFLAGATAVMPAFFLERWFGAGNLVAAGHIPLWSLVVLAAVEEVLKFLAVYLTAMRTGYYDEPVDAMTYLVTAALGFAMAENTLYILNILLSNPETSYLLAGNFRFLGATLLHVVASATVGAIIGLSYYLQRRWKFLTVLAGLTAAIALHTTFNYFMINLNNGGRETLKIFALLWLAGVVIIFLFERVKRVINQPNLISK